MFLSMIVYLRIYFGQLFNCDILHILKHQLQWRKQQFFELLFFLEFRPRCDLWAFLQYFIVGEPWVKQTEDFGV